MADSLESTCSRPDDPVLPEHPRKSLALHVVRDSGGRCTWKLHQIQHSKTAEHSFVERGQAPVTGAAARGALSRFATTGCSPQTQVPASFLFSQSLPLIGPILCTRNLTEACCR